MPAFLAGIILSCYLSCGSIVIVLFLRPPAFRHPCVFPGPFRPNANAKLLLSNPFVKSPAK